MRNFAGSIDRSHFYRHWFWPKKKNSGLIISATEKILKNGFHHAKEHFDQDFSAYHSAEISGFLHFQSRHEKPERDKNKRISFLCVTLPDLSTDLTFTGTDFGRKKNSGLLSSATEKILKNGFHHA